MAQLGLAKISGHPFVRGYGIPLVAALGGIILLSISAAPLVRKIRVLREERAVAQAKLATLTAKVEKLEDFAADSVSLDEDFKRFDQAIPSEINIPTLLTQVQTVAAQAGVKITALQFGGARTEAEEAEARQVNKVRLKFAAEGSYTKLVKLLQILETATRLIDVESVGYNIRESEAKGSVLAVELTLISYYTSPPILVAEEPITFGFSDEDFQRNSDVLRQFTPYETEIPFLPRLLLQRFARLFNYLIDLVFFF